MTTYEKPEGYLARLMSALDNCTDNSKKTDMHKMGMDLYHKMYDVYEESNTDREYQEKVREVIDDFKKA